MNRFLTTDEALRLLHICNDCEIPFQYDREKHRLLIPYESQGGQEEVKFRLPIHVPEPESPDEFEEEGINYVLVLIQSGSAAVGYFEHDLNLDHKVFKSYMVRKKQGKSQVKYLKSKGKSRAGSRVRLANTVNFFENINERLQQYFDDYNVHRIAVSCSKTLIPFVFNSKVECPFTKKDERILKIPKHLPAPNYEVLLEAHRFLMKGELIFDEPAQAFVERLLQKAGAGSD
ncbi:hypothetical protein AAG747_18350 [Rapidithrix thailandica]|uniref:VLRF1 domain-containing protein n=1 Tax=Rapidithrix thailandica TaxID=413964 RepID=A0AAW9S8R8_9BACT